MAVATAVGALAGTSFSESNAKARTQDGTPSPRVASVQSQDAAEVGRLQERATAAAIYRYTVAYNADLYVKWLEAAAANEAAAQAQRTGARSGQASRSSGGGGGGDVWSCIRQRESGGNYSSAGGGAYQFDRQTWASVGGSGDPASASPSEQDARAQALYRQRGFSPWTTARACGA